MVKCKHDIIDNGTRISECRLCKGRAVLNGFDWVVEDAPKASNVLTGARAVIKVNGQVIGRATDISYDPNPRSIASTPLPASIGRFRPDPDKPGVLQVSFDDGKTWQDYAAFFQ